MMNQATAFSVQAAILFLALPLFAQREPVLKQIDLPHSYYYREMYLPQLTSGPSSVAWAPDSHSVVYSMQGCLWRQRLNSTVAEQLTFGPGYDYQPDWSPDGKWIVFTRYDRDAVELQLCEVATGKTHPITRDGAVNVEPRWSPDGKRIAFVSTSYNKRFHIFLAAIQNGEITKIDQLTEERRSSVPRYYYSPFDHEISPTWSPDGSEIIFISNHENVYGTGGFRRMKAEMGAQPREIRYEETAWKAHPDWSPDGKKVLYSSYLGNQWHQLWVMTSEGGDPFPLSYGDFDATAARWSPDGKRIAFISNRDGNTSLWVQETIGGDQRQVVPLTRRYVRPMGRLKLLLVDSKGQPASARVSVTGEDGRTYAPDHAWIRADDSFVRSERPFETHYFHSSGDSEIVAPPGKITVEVMKGLEHKFERTQLLLKPGEERTLEVRIRPIPMPEGWENWVSGDLHVHMNYGGVYRNRPEQMLAQADAEDVNVVFNLIVNKEQRIPDIGYFSGKLDGASTASTLLLHSQEFHTSYWGHLGLLNLKRNYLIPDYSSYFNTAAASPYPLNAVVADLAHEQGGLVGYVHPFDTAGIQERQTHELPVDVALGKVDYLEVVGFSDHKVTASDWYRLLNCGFRLPAGAGTDVMANFSSLRGPVGLNRVYVKTDEPLNVDRWLEALRAGHSFATNGPLLGFTLAGKKVGEEIKLSVGQDLEFSASLRSIVPVDHLEIVSNGRVIKEIELTGDRTATDVTGTVHADQSGWYVLRAWSENPAYPILDSYLYATTSPIYVTTGDAPIRSPEDAAYFIAWIDRIIENAEAHSGYNTESEKSETLRLLNEARNVFLQRQ